MKKIFKMIGIIAFSTVIAFGMTACSDGGDDDGTDTGGDTSKVAAPTANPPAGAVAQGEAVTLESATSGAVIYYTTNGTSPTAQSTEFTTPISINADMTIRAIAMKEGMTNSDVVSFSYTIDESLVAMPAPNPVAGTVQVGTQVALTCATEGTTIRYTTDGSTPTTSSTIYETYFVITDDITIKAIAIKGVNQSNVMTAEFKLPRYTVTFNSAGGSEVANATIKHGDKVTKPADPTRVYLPPNGLYLTTSEIQEYHYTFAGWNASPFNFDTAITENITLTAQWTAPSFPHTAKTWETILSELPSDGSNVFITVFGNNPVEGGIFHTNTSTFSGTLTLKGNGTLSLSSQGDMFRLGVFNTQTLIIDSEDLILQGHSNNNAALINITNNGYLELKNGTITGNKNNIGFAGGGVSIYNGSFIMSGGVISGNSAPTGGGVFIELQTDTFTKTGGIIYGNNEGSNSNLATETEPAFANLGHAVCWQLTEGRRLRNTTHRQSDGTLSTSSISSPGWTSWVYTP